MNQSHPSRNIKTQSQFPSKLYLSPHNLQSDKKTFHSQKYHQQYSKQKYPQQDINRLKQKYTQLDHKYKTQLDQKNLNDIDFINKHDSNLRFIGQLRNQLSSLHQQLSQKKLQFDDLSQTQSKLKTLLQQKNLQIQQLRKQTNTNLSTSDSLQHQKITLITHIETFKKNNLTLSRQYTQLEHQNNQCYNKQINLSNYLQQLQLQCTMLKNKIKDYQNTNNNIDHQIQQIIFNITQLQSIGIQSQENIKILQSHNLSISNNINQYKSQTISNQKLVQSEQTNNNQLIKNVKYFQHLLKIRQNQIKQGHSVLSNLNSQNQHLIKINQQIPHNIQSCKQHLSLLGSLNRQLVQCLQNLSQDDKKVEQIINRSSRVQNIKKRLQQAQLLEYYCQKQTERTDSSFRTSHRRFIC